MVLYAAHGKADYGRVRKNESWQNNNFFLTTVCKLYIMFTRRQNTQWRVGREYSVFLSKNRKEKCYEGDSFRETRQEYGVSD